MTSADSRLREETILYEWTRLLFGVLDRLGLKDAVLCPGSRNAPLIYGALAQPGLTCHSVIDERSAGFFALGLARASGRPVALVCTSGSALAHFFPAVIEAHASGIPLYVISADRPSHLQSCGAAQTIDQVGFFGSFAGGVQGWDEPSAQTARLRQWARKVQQLWTLSRSPLPGPVHLNVPLSKPLEPLLPTSGVETQLHDRVTTLIEAVSESPGCAWAASEEAGMRWLNSFQSAPSVRWMSLGPVEPSIVPLARELAAALDLPLIAESPGLSDAFSAELVARRWLERPSNKKLHLLHIGPPMISGAWNRLLERDDVQQWVLAGPTHLEPTGRGHTLTGCGLASTLQAALDWVPRLSMADFDPGPEDPQARLPLQLDVKQWLAATLSLSEPEPHRLHEPLAVKELLVAANRVRNVVLGNSSSVRLAGWVAPLVPSRDWSVFSVRGANGIDGHIALSCGIASASAGPTLALLGDVAAAHDLGSLQLAAQVRSSLILVIIENEGGRIFEQLPGAQLWSDRPQAARFFLTPPGIDWSKAAEAVGLTATHANDLEQLRHTIAQRQNMEGAHLVVAHTDAQTTRSFLGALAHAENSA